jgi:tetratricopeptide (TPR) repeat protein
MPHDGDTHDAAFLNDGKTILTTCYDGSFGIWESKTGKRLAPPIKTGCRGIRLALTPNGSYAILGGHTIGTTRTAISVIKLDQVTLRDERPTDDIVAMAEFFAGHRIQSATPQRLTNEEMVALYERAQEPIRWVLGLEEYESWAEQKQKEQLARMLQIFDGDQDGFLSKTEAPPSIERRFDSFDKNSDSNLDPDELAQAIQRQEIVHFVSSAQMEGSLLDPIDWANTNVSDLHPSFRQLNRHFDEDGDKRLSREEVDSMLTKAPFLQLEWISAMHRQGFSVTRVPSSKLAGLSPSDQETFMQARGLAMEGSRLLRESKLDASKELYRKASDTFQSIPEPRPAEVWRLLGIAQFRCDEIADSLSSLQKHLELNNEKNPSQSRNTITWWFIAIATAETGDKEKAREYYDQLIKLQKPLGAASTTYDGLRKRLEELLEVEDSEAD